MRIYLIDDDHLSLFLAKNVLDLVDAPHDVTTFLSAQKALDALYAGGGDNIPELILLDLNMPIMDGWEFLDALAPLQTMLCEKCTICILTSSLDIADTIRLKDYPFVSGLIHKPIKSEDIQLLVSGLLNDPVIQ